MHISDGMARTKSPQSLDARILRRMRASKGGTVFTPRHFLDFGSRAGVDQALSRLTRAGRIRRWGRGLYDIARQHEWFGTLSPDLEKGARAVAASRGYSLRPSGVEAANLLGLSDQVPAKWVYLTDGPSSTMILAGVEVTLKHCSARRMALSARPTGLIVSALDSLGAGHITEARLQQLQSRLTPEDRILLLRELGGAPIWMHPWLRFLATGWTGV